MLLLSTVLLTALGDALELLFSDGELELVHLKAAFDSFEFDLHGISPSFLFSIGC